jgi:hypothetical protein
MKEGWKEQDDGTWQRIYTEHVWGKVRRGAMTINPLPKAPQDTYLEGWIGELISPIGGRHFRTLDSKPRPRLTEVMEDVDREFQVLTRIFKEP